MDRGVRRHRGVPDREAGARYGSVFAAGDFDYAKCWRSANRRRSARRHSTSRASAAVCAAPSARSAASAVAALSTWAVARGIELEELTLARPSLEDVYLGIVGEAEVVA